jgi:iron complex transport system substrate-binding protein
VEGTATAPVTGTPAAATAAPTGTAAAAAYPLTLTDMTGRSVTIAAQPQRVVATSPTTVEAVYAVGGTLVAHDASSDYPPDVAELPTVGRAYAPDFEGIVAQNPDLVIADSINQARFVQQFETLGVPVLMVGAASFDDVETAMRLVSQALGLSEKAEEDIAKLEEDRDAVITQVPDQQVKALILIMDADRRIYAAQPDTYVGSLAQLLKAENPAAGLSGAAGPYPGYVLLSAEQAVTENPDVILTISPAPAPAPLLSDVLKDVPGYSDLSAVKAGKVHELDVDLFLQAPGPRVVEAMSQMLSLLYGTATGG